MTTIRDRNSDKTATRLLSSKKYIHTQYNSILPHVNRIITTETLYEFTTAHRDTTNKLKTACHMNEST